MPSHFLDLTSPPCAVSRWKPGIENTLPQATSKLSIEHSNGSSVHYITWKPGPTSNGTFTEVIYVVGGSVIPVEGDEGDCNDTATIHGIVEKMVIDPNDPDVSDHAVWQLAPSLNYGRTNHNTVILLDGSMLAVGGIGFSGSTCVWPLKPERFMPPEVLDQVPPSSAWVSMPPQAIPRQYHSVAGLLPDGRVVSAGGKNLPTSQPNNDVPDHSLEIYSPFYVFHGSKPDIDRSTLLDPAQPPYGYDSPLAFDVTLAVNAAVDRVALIRNGCSTHAFDPDQRYVELRINTNVPGSGGTRHLNVQTPADGNWAPPGYYYLVVVDDHGRPSEAEWIRIQ